MGQGKDEKKRKMGNQPVSLARGFFENLYCNASKSCVWSCLTHEIYLLMDHGL